MIDPHQWRGDGVWTRSRDLEGMVIGYVISTKGGARTTSGVERKYVGSRHRRELVFVSTRCPSFRLFFLLFSSL